MPNQNRLAGALSFMLIGLIHHALLPHAVGAAVPQVAVPERRPAIFETALPSARVRIIRVNGDELAAAAAARQPFAAELPLPNGVRIGLELARFSVTTSRSQFVVGNLNGPDVKLDFDPDSVVLLHGHAPAYPGSHVYIAISDYTAGGWIDLGPGRDRYGISNRAPGGMPLPAGQISVFPTLGVHEGPEPNAAHCGVLDDEGHREPAPQQPAYGPAPGLSPVKGLQQLQIAVETDYEYYSRFNDANAAAAYVLQLYGAVSAIYDREINTYVNVSFARIWTTPADLFNEPDPLVPFRDYWQANMGHITRDTAQFFTGRRDLPYGGVAYLNGLCNNGSYSVAGYAIGSFATPDMPSIYSQDVEITAHELGHNCASQHTNAYGIDDCADPNPAPPQRGTIMSYCTQTVSGGQAVMDMYFHTIVDGEMRNYVAGRSCIADDCNRNGVLDSTDISGGASDDANLNGVPDECEDCNGNGQLDNIDILTGVSTDLDGNTIPDECQPDCNGNGIPDSRDISLGTSDDAYANGIPDECEEDCNNNSVSDYTEIQANLALDIDRNARLDACQDCDDDGTPDMTELAGANNCWAVSTNDAIGLREFYSLTGVRVRNATGGQIRNGQDVIIGPNGHVLVSSANNDRVIEYHNGTGAFIRNLVPQASGGLDYPTGMLLTPGGNLLVSSRNTHSVLEYNGGTGAFVRVFVTAGSGGLSAPFGLTFGPNGNVFVASGNNRVLEYNAATGAFVRTVVSTGSGGLTDPRGLVFTPDGRLLVASFGTDQVLEYNGATGQFIRQFNYGGVDDVLRLDGPWGIRIGPDGHVYVSRNLQPRLHVTTARIFAFEVDTGWLRRSYIVGNDTGMYSTAGFVFRPHDNVDCNLNLLPDSCDISSGVSADCNANSRPDECDIASGTSQDADNDGIPDECQGGCEPCDVNCDGSVNPFDIQPFTDLLSNGGSPCSSCAADTNADGSINPFDIQGLVDCLNR